MSHRILLVDDEIDILEFVRYNLQKEGYEVFTAQNGAEALKAAAKYRPHLILLDMMMPVMDGAQTCRAIRQDPQLRDTMVVFLSALGEEDQQLTGFGVGADDYLTKPFATAELLARLRAMTRQSVQLSSRLTFGSLCLDQTTFELSTPSGSFRLANKEYQMMELFLRNPRQIIPTERFLERIWGYDSEVEVSVVWVYISYLRKKLAALQADVEIRASRNLGYALEVRA